MPASAELACTALASRYVSLEDLGLPAAGVLGADAALIAAATLGAETVVAVVLPSLALAGESLTAYLAAVSPYGCPPPGSLVRAYVLPDLTVPSIVLKEHHHAPDGMGGVFAEFDACGARPRWLAALQDAGPVLTPALAWTRGDRPLVLTQAETEAVVRAALPDLVATPDSYLGRGLPLLADPGLRTAWEDVVSLGPPTKVRRITGREFPIWIALPEHEPALLASPFVARAQGLAGA